MDQTFFLRAERMLVKSRPAAIDHDVLVATLAAHQAASRTAREEAQAKEADGNQSLPADPLPELILGGRAWRNAAAAQGGCFNRAIAKHPVNGS